MSDVLNNLDEVALRVDLPAMGLVRGQVGTVVEALADGHFEVEFVDGEGRTYAMAALPSGDLIRLRHERVGAA